jgi:alanyl-tRNA synthetase
MELDQALETGAMAFFGEKYPDRVRVVDVRGFSKELCGGTHVSRTGDIGLLKITSEGSISAGVRRVEAVTGEGALEQYREVTTVVRNLAATLKTTPSDLPEAAEKLVESQKNLEKQVETLRLKLAQAQLADVESRVRLVKDVKVLSIRLEALERGQMRILADSLRQRLQSGVVVLATTSNDKVALIAALTPDLTKRLHAGKIAQAVAQKLGGTGGGRPDIAEAGGKDPARLDTVLNEVYEIVGAML